MKTGKTSVNNRSLSISQEPTAKYFFHVKICVVGFWK